MNSKQDDFDLIKLYIEREDEAALQTLLDRYVRLGFTVIYRIVKNKEEAEDVLQNVLIKVIRALPKFKMDSSFKTWFTRICYNEGINAYKRSKRKHTEAIEDFEFMLSDPRSLKGEVADDLRNEVIWNQVNALPPKYRSVLLCFYQDEMSIKEVADHLGINENTVKTHLTRAKNQLKGLLESNHLSHETLH